MNPDDFSFSAAPTPSGGDDDSRELLFRLAKFVPGVMYVFVREPDGRYDMPFVSEGVRRLYGVSPEEVRADAEYMLKRVHPDDRLELRRKMSESLVHRTPWSARYRVTLDDGRERWHDGYSQPEVEDNGRVTFHGYILDATDRVVHENAALEVTLLRRENEAKTRFLQRMSHELRTPLNAVLGFSQLLLSSDRCDDEDVRFQIEHIQKAGRHMDRLIGDLLDLANTESVGYRLFPQAVALDELVAEIVALMQPLARARDLLLSVVAPTGGRPVLADPTRLRQVLFNLLTNAIKYNRDDGWVSVSLEERGDRVVVHVADGGIGLSADQLGHLFEPFNRLGAERLKVDGLGIGLVVTRRLVELMDGRIDVVSEPGVGSRFSVTLPVDPAAGAAPAAP